VRVAASALIGLGDGDVAKAIHGSW
jgi:hypothetical protein